MYAKFINETTIQPFTGKALVYAGRTYVNPTSITLSRAGFLPVVEMEMFEPADGYILSVRYSTSGGSIIKSYVAEACDELEIV